MCTSTAHVHLLQFLIYFIASSNAISIGKFESRGRGLAIVYGNTVPEMRA